MTLLLRMMLAAGLAAAALGSLLLTAGPHHPAHATAIVAECQPGQITRSDGKVYICTNDGKWVPL